LLDLPFFDVEHRVFARGLREWLDGRTKTGSEDDAAGSVRQWVRELGDAGWLRPCVPSAFGGQRSALDVRTLSLARERLAYRDALADFAFAMQGLGGAAVVLFGDGELQQRVLPRIAAGTCIAAFALSEFAAGSDVAALTTTARRDGGEYVINGEKAWISNAGIADLYVVFARTGEAGSRGLSAFAVDASTAGVTAEGNIETISPHPLGTLTLRDVRIPVAMRIGEEGAGFKIAMSVLDLFRATVGAAAVGFARRALDESVAHVKRRELFGTLLGEMQLTQAAIATMATDADAAALLVYRAAWTKDMGAARITREAAMAKWFATEAAGRVCDRAVQLFGGRGVTRGEIVERLYRDVRALRIYEGASEIQQVVIAKQVMNP
jgi:acyl-CoA dehydrogenase